MHEMWQRQPVLRQHENLGYEAFGAGQKNFKSKALLKFTIMTDQELARTIGAAMVSSLPVFAVFAITQRMTNEFNRGWHEAIHGNREEYALKKFSYSLLWFVPFTVITIVLFGMIFHYSSNDDHMKVLLFLLIPISVASLTGTIYIYSMKITIMDEKLVFKTIFNTTEITLSSIHDIKCFAGYLVTTLNDGKIHKMPLFFGKLRNLGFSLNKIIS